MEQAPFSIHLPQTILDDLFERLERVRWPDEAEDAGWAMSVLPLKVEM